VRPLLVDLGREYRGGQHQALLLLLGLRERGHAPELIAVRDSLLAIRAKDAGIPVHPADPRRRRITAALQIRKLLEERGIDVLHANEPHALSSAWFARAHRIVPIVASRRIALFLSQSHFSRARYEAAARIAAVSYFVERSVIQSGLPADHVLVIYDGVSIPGELSRTERASARKTLGIAPENFCVGNVAAFVPEKGHALLIEAFAKLRSKFPGCVLLLRGEGPERAALEALAQKLQVAEAVTFLPASVEIETIFAALDVFAFPSHEEPLGSALLAAMAHGLPVVAIARGGVPEVLENGANGLLVNDLDPEAFASAMARIIENHDGSAARLGAAARETIVARFSAHQMVKETLGLYEVLIAARAE
jgi:glycosyltransferase involved in cell wall biosynthesis